MKAISQSFKNSFKLLAFFILSITYGLTWVNAQCPTITNNTQSLCDIESVLVGDLQAIDNGGGIVWYETATSTVPLPNTASLISGEDYYADDNTGTCGVRERVDVIILGPPTGPNFQGVCLDDPTLATVADLNATGNDVQWYLSPTGGVPLNDSTILVDDTLYYADQANPDTGCRTSRLSVLVKVGFTPIPSGNAIQEFCVTPTFTPTVADLVASGTNNWYISLFSAFALPSSTPLINGQIYYGTTLDPPCESAGRLGVLVVLNNGLDSGNDGTLDLCESDANTPIDLFTLLGGSPQSGGTWSPDLASGTGVYDPNVDPDGIYTYTLISNNICPDESSTVTVTLAPATNAGTNGSIDLCSTDTIIDLFDSLGGTPNDSGTWSPSLTSGTGEFNPAIDNPGLYTYTVTGIPPCSDASATVNVSVTQFLDSGTNGEIEICDNNGTIDLFDSLGGTPDNGGIWSPMLTSGTGVFDPLLDTEGIYTYSFLGNAPCADTTATVNVTVNALPNAGSYAIINICSNDTATIDLFDSLGGTPDAGGTWTPTLASGTGIFDPTQDAPGIYTYELTNSPCPNDSATVNISILQEPNAGLDATVDICDNTGNIDLFDSLEGTPDAGGTWSPVLNSGTGIFDPNIDAEGIYTYTVIGTDPCANASANVTVSVTPFLEAGQNGTLTICTNDAAVDLINSLGGTPDPGGIWSPELASGTGIFDPSLDSGGTYTYTTSASGSCNDDSATVIVSLEIAPDAGSDGTLTICSSDTNPVDLFNSLNGTPQTGGIWSPSLTSGTGVFNPNTDAEGIYTYTINTICGNSSATVTVSINELNNAGSDGSVELCSNASPTDLFNSLNGTPQSGGIWSPALASGTGVFDPTIDIAGVYTYTVSGSTSSCPAAEANVTVSIIALPNPGNDNTLNICIDDTNTVDLFNSLGGSPDSGGIWSPALTSGTGVFDPTIDVAGVYTYSVTSTECGLTASADITVIINNLPDVTGLEISIDDNIICLGFPEDVVVDISGANQLPDGDYTIEYQLSDANTSLNTTSITITDGNSSFIIPQSLLPNPGSTIVTLSQLFFTGQTCSADTTSIEAVKIFVEDVDTPQIIDNGGEFCIKDSSTIADLSINIIDSEIIIWYDQLEGGTAYSDSEILQDGQTYYAAIQSRNGCESTVRLEVTISLIKCIGDLLIPDGFSPNGDSINDVFDILYLDDLYPNFKLSIYNRYGNILYKGDINSPKWDGTERNKDSALPVGVYFYILEFNDGEREPLQGRVYLSR